MFGNYSPSFFLLLLYHPLRVSLFSFPLLWISYLHLLSVPFDNDTIQGYIGLPDLNSEADTELDKCETQLGIFSDTAML